MQIIIFCPNSLTWFDKEIELKNKKITVRNLTASEPQCIYCSFSDALPSLRNSPVGFGFPIPRILEI